MNVMLSRWGNSLAVRVPKEAVEEAGLQEGDRLDVVVDRGRLVLVPRLAKPSLDDLIDGITTENLPAAEFGNIVGGEVW
jgi:antitoxin MazE